MTPDARLLSAEQFGTTERSASRAVLVTSAEPHSMQSDAELVLAARAGGQPARDKQFRRRRSLLNVVRRRLGRDVGHTLFLTRVLSTQTSA